MRFWVVLAGVITFAAPAVAQAEDPMALQRCVWSCLASAKGASDPAYHQCVAARCAAPQAQVQVSPGANFQSQITVAPGGPAWQLSAMSPQSPPYLDGRAAKVRAQGGVFSFTYACARNGQSYVFIDGTMISGLPGGSAQSLVVVIDERVAFTLPMQPWEGGLTVNIPLNAHLLSGLRQGAKARLQTAQREVLGEFSLTGAAGALSQSVAYCSR